MLSAHTRSYQSDRRRVGTDTNRLVEVFHICDEDKKGFLSREDLKVAVVMLFGYKPSKAEVDSMISTGQKNNEARSMARSDIARRRCFYALQPVDDLGNNFVGGGQCGPISRTNQHTSLKAALPNFFKTTSDFVA
ncbi:EF-hand calcium-binding domain-containing protein 11 isoform X2 [Pleurodeles waltl]|uniref:EF-hand calcium-binding domain-containing protein 11 isoform X2 n=1 Tax=Pleurodeles waltl TaxID=8319 RepID=UPI003709BBDD